MTPLIDLVGSCWAVLSFVASGRHLRATILDPRAIVLMAACATSTLLPVCPAGEPKADFTDTARSIRKAIFQVGSDKGGHGTAWVISKKHRLLATNAHVADIGANSPPGTFRAIMNGTNTAYNVTRVWYHPGVSRAVTEDEKLPVRSGAFGGYLGMALDLDFDGVKVREVLRNTSASKAGIKVKDEILAVNGAKVQTREEFLGMLARKKPGDAVKLKISRAENEIDLQANLSERPPNPTLGLGKVFVFCPDLAVLQLSDEGPDLPVELKMAPPKVVFDLQARTVAMMGYPGHDTKGLPKSDQIALATYHKGDVSRVTNFELEGTTDEQSQFIQCTMDSFGGFSGSPIFLASGEVVALLNSKRRADPNDKNSQWLTQGVRIDSLWELLAHHELDRFVDVPLPKEKLLVERWLRPDPNTALYQRLSKMVKDADYLIDNKRDYAAAIEKCDQAIKIYKLYAPAYYARARGFEGIALRLVDSKDRDKRLAYLIKAASDAAVNTRLHPEPTVASARLELGMVLHEAWETNKKERFIDALKRADTILSAVDMSTWDRACFLSQKASALDGLGKRQEAERLYRTVLQMYPDDPLFWDHVGIFWKSTNQAQSRIHYAMAKALRKNNVLGAESNWKERKVVSEVKESLTAKDPKDNRGCHQHVWTVELEAGYYYRVDLKNPTFKSDKDYDPYLRVADENNKILFEDDDGGGYPHARIFFTAPRSGSYTMMASSWYPNQTGGYVLTVTRIAKDQ